VLLDVDKLLFQIPFESHRYTYCITSWPGNELCKGYGTDFSST
jgi:hypothetical protein